MIRWWCVLPLGLLACSKRVEKPTPPDLSDLVVAYETPTGTFGQNVVDQMKDSVEAILEDQGDMGLDEQLDELFDSVDGDDPEDASTQADVDVGKDNTIRIEGEGFLEVGRICDGWGDEPVPDPANGSLSLNVNVTDVSVDPVLWATAERCRYMQGGNLVELRAGTRREVGDLRIFVGNNLTLDDLEQSPILVEVDASGSFDGGATFETLNFDLRILIEEGSFEVRVPVDDGDLIVRTVEDEILLVRAANGTFECTAEGLCRNEQGDVVDLLL